MKNQEEILKQALKDATEELEQLTVAFSKHIESKNYPAAYRTVVDLMPNLIAISFIRDFILENK